MNKQKKGKKKVKKKIKEQKKKKVTRYSKLQDKIKEYSKYIPIPETFTKTNVDLHTNIDITKSISTVKIIKKTFKLENNKLQNEPIKTKRYRLYPNEDQEKVLQEWFLGYIDMYNYVISLIRCQFIKELSGNCNFKLVDLEIDLNIGKIKKKATKIKENLRKKYNINMHILDYALTDAIAMFKSKISNLKNGHIKKSKLKYLKKMKNNKIIKIEKQICGNNSFCMSELGSFMKTKPSINFKTAITTVAIVQYDTKKDKYYLLVRSNIQYDSDSKEYEERIKFYDDKIETSNEYLNFIKKNKLKTDTSIIKKLNKELDLNKRRLNKEKIYQNKMKFKNNKKQNNTVLSIDPGIRTFLSCLSNDHLLEIGKKIAVTIKRKLKSIDNINKNETIPKKEKDKIINRTEEKIKNKINDYHWKIVNYLSSNYSHILVGNFSTKKMGESDVNKMLKRIAKKMRFYVFKQRLQYKCFLKGVQYKEVDEYCTSKCCSSCGNFKKDLGSNKVYNCNKCGVVLGRDINASKNILMRSIE
jgi:hypothetical protein